MSQFGSPPLGVQIHDYSPGITDSGLFWTVAVPPDTVTYDSDLQTRVRGGSPLSELFSESRKAVTREFVFRGPVKLAKCRGDTSTPVKA